MRKVEVYFSEKLRYKKFEFWDIFLLLVVWLMVTMFFGILFLYICNIVFINPIIQILIFAISMIRAWTWIFILTKKYLLKYRCILIKKEFDKLYSLIVCLGLIYTVALSIQSLGVQINNTEQFTNDVIIIIFVATPNVLIKPFFINDKRLVIERKQVYTSRRNRFHYWK